MWRGFEKNMTEGSGGDFWINQHDMYGTGSKVKKRGKARYTYQISRDFLERLSSRGAEVSRLVSSAGGDQKLCIPVPKPQSSKDDNCLNARCNRKGRDPCVLFCTE